MSQDKREAPSMLGSLSKVLDFLKAPTKIIVMAWLAAGFLAFAPLKWLQSMGISDRSSFGGLAAALFVVLSSVLLVTATLAAWKWWRTKQAEGEIRRMLFKRLEECDVHEQAVLREFLIREASTLCLPIQHPVVAGLMGKRILLPVGQLGNASVVGLIHNLTISPPLRERVTPAIVGFDPSIPLEQQKEFFQQNRPDFIPELDAWHARRYLPW